MNNFINYIYVLALSILFMSCETSSIQVLKEGNSINFYRNNLKFKEIILDDMGVILTIQNFKNEKLDTEWIADNSNLKEFFEYYGNGQIKVKGYLKNQKKHSLWKYYDREGHLLIERYFSYDMPSNIWIWYDKDNHDLIDKYKIYSDKRDDGLFTRYYQSLKIKEQKVYVDNKLNGDYNLFYDNSLNTIHIKGKYLAGAKINNWEIFDEQGVFQDFFK